MWSSRNREQTSELTVFFMRGNIDLIWTDFMFMSDSVRPQRQIKDKAPGQTGMLLLFLAGFIDHWTSCRAQHLRPFRERPFWEVGAESGFLLLETTNAPAGLPNVKLCLDQGCTHTFFRPAVVRPQTPLSHVYFLKGAYRCDHGNYCEYEDLTCKKCLCNL